MKLQCIRDLLRRSLKKENLPLVFSGVAILVSILALGNTLLRDYLSRMPHQAVKITSACPFILDTTPMQIDEPHKNKEFRVLVSLKNSGQTPARIGPLRFYSYSRNGDLIDGEAKMLIPISGDYSLLPKEEKFLLFGMHISHWPDTPQFMMNGGLFLNVNGGYQEIPLYVQDETHEINPKFMREALSEERDWNGREMKAEGQNLERLRQWLVSIP